MYTIKIQSPMQHRRINRTAISKLAKYTEKVLQENNHSFRCIFNAHSSRRDNTNTIVKHSNCPTSTSNSNYTNPDVNKSKMRKHNSVYVKSSITSQSVVNSKMRAKSKQSLVIEPEKPILRISSYTNVNSKHPINYRKNTSHLLKLIINKGKSMHGINNTHRNVTSNIYSTYGDKKQSFNSQFLRKLIRSGSPVKLNLPKVLNVAQMYSRLKVGANEPLKLFPRLTINTDVKILKNDAKYMLANDVYI